MNTSYVTNPQILTKQINTCNVNHIQAQIKRKQSYKPFLATTKDAVGVITDYDVFPYPRYFRGQALSSKPIVAEREAGWRIRRDWCYNPSVKNVVISHPIPNLTFQMPHTLVPPGGTCNVAYR